MVRAGNDNELIDVFEKKSLVAIGWEKIGDLSKFPTRKATKEKYEEVYDHKERRKNTNAGQLYRFANEIEKGDIVLSFNKSTREYLVGKIESDYQWKSEADFTGRSHYKHVREVEWEKTISRDDFSVSAKNSLGSSLTVFRLNEHLTEIKALLEGKSKADEDEVEDEQQPLLEEVEGKAGELISDKISNMDPYDFQDLVAAVLRTLGYKTKVSSRGPDEGIDIVAHPDALGFEKPIVKVQVKRRKNTVGSEELQSFIGAIGDNDKGLYVSTGGYTSHAEKAADKSHRRLTLLDRDDFIELLLKNYEDIEPEYKTLIPLKKVYIPREE